MSQHEPLEPDEPTGRHAKHRSIESETIELLNQPVDDACNLTTAIRSNADSNAFQNRTINAKYELLRVIGQGGLGIVWLARDVGLNRYVALKEIKANSDNTKFFKQFRREAEITGRLEHPGIVSIHHFGCDETTGKAFYVMRFLGRRTLQDAIDELHDRRKSGHDDKLLFNRLLSSFVNVCRTLGHAHDQKIIHRDLKPSNIAIDDHGQVTILDWGLAKINDAVGIYEIGGRTEVDDLHAHDGDPSVCVAGTPLYMAPEQALGLLDEIDVTTDVYGLGGILYAILTGLGPHALENQNSIGRLNPTEHLQAIARNRVIPPKDRLTFVPAELSAICMKSLSTKRYMRYQSAESLAEDIERHLLGENVEAYQAPLRIRVAKWLRRHPTLTQVLLLTASLVIFGIIAVYNTSRKYRSEIFSSRSATAIDSIEDLRSKIEVEIENLVNDARLISDLHSSILPDESTITNLEESQTQRPDSSTLGNPKSLLVMPSKRSDSRYENLFVSFLEARPAYLSLTRIGQIEPNKLKELVRVARDTYGQRPEVVPYGKLNRDSPADTVVEETPLELAGVRVELWTNDRLPPFFKTRQGSPLILNAIKSRHNASADQLEILQLEFDLLSRLKEIVPAIVPSYVDICIVDSNGRIVFEFREQLFLEKNLGRSLESTYPGLNQLPRDAVKTVRLANGAVCFGKNVKFGQTSSPIELGLVAFIRSF